MQMTSPTFISRRARRRSHAQENHARPEEAALTQARVKAQIQASKFVFIFP